MEFTHAQRSARHSILHKRNELLATFIICAVEGGSGYWAQFKDFQWREKGSDSIDPDPLHTLVLVRNDEEEGDPIPCVGADWKPYANNREWKRVSITTIERAIDRMKQVPASELGVHPSYIGTVLAAWSDPERADIDSELADIVLQIAVFGKVHFG